MEMGVLALNQETGTVPHAASPITDDVLNVSGAHTKVSERFRQTYMHLRTQLNLTMPRFHRNAEAGMVVYIPEAHPGRKTQQGLHPVSRAGSKVLL
jgi:hypothetical protein